MFVFVWGIVPSLFAVRYSLFLQDSGALYLGGTEGFVDVTLRSLNRQLLSNEGWIPALVEIALFAGLTIHLIYQIWVKRSWSVFVDKTVVWSVFLVATVIAVFMQNLLLGVNYPQDRSALYLFPFVLVASTFMLDSLPKKRLVWSIGWAVILLYFPVDLIRTANTDYSRFWRGEYMSPKLQAFLGPDADSGIPPSISGPMVRALAWEQSNFQQGTEASAMTGWEYPNRYADYIYLRKKYDPTDYEPDYREVFFDPISEQRLLKRVKPAQWVLEKDTAWSSLQNEGSEFSNLLEVSSETLPGVPLRVELDMDYETEAFPFSAAIVVSDINHEGTNNYYALQHLERMYDFKNHPRKRVRCSFFIPPAEATSDRIVIYIWNLTKTPYNLQGRMRLYADRSNT